MEFDPLRHQRRSIRYAGYDYRAAGAYFVTICAYHKRCAFGRMEGVNVRLHPYGQIVIQEWEKVAQLRNSVELDQYIVMPDHFHAILFLHLPTESILSMRANSLGAIVGQFKSAVTRRINIERAELALAPVQVWQRNFYERIIRSENELEQTRRYIIENPERRAVQSSLE